ncbi:MAG TPA: AmmeMemoRadiSam system protein B [Dehalococcoidia bacterium]|nr:AmmeMemoRadiSam system protein B [Dehalococcoidia bacterium]
MPLPARPQLRPLEIKRLRQDGHEYFYLRDMLSLSGEELLVPLELGPALALFDGEHELPVIRARCLLGAGLDLAPTDLLELVRRLDAALLLEGERVEQVKREVLAAFRAAPCRPPALADRVYPGELAALRNQLAAFELRAERAPAPQGAVAGVLSPHIDYARGGPVYAAGWRQAADAARAAKRVILLGTDHAGGGGRLTLTHQQYATPFGPLPTDVALVNALAGALGEEQAFAEELHHRNEHSIELASVWLHHARGGEPLSVLPLLCGHPGPFLSARTLAGGGIERAIELLREAVAGGALVVVAGDLAHVGPEFGDPRPFGAAQRAAVEAADRAALAACSAGAEALLREVGTIEDRYRLCGLTPLALALAIMPPVRFEQAAYAQCPADERNASFVSIAAGCFTAQ